MLGLGLKRMFGINRGGLSLPFAQNLLGAWLHKKAPQETTILDERSGIDKTREPIRGQGLKFTGVESIYSGYTPTLSSSTTFKIETEVIFSGISSTNQYIVDFRNSLNTGFFIGIEVNSLELKFRITGTNVNTGVILELNTRYFIEFSYNCSTGVATIILNGIEVYSNTVSYNDANKATRNLALGRVSYTSVINLLATLGYFRFIENDVPVIEYSFEDGLTDTVYNRISNNYHGTISGATLSTFRVEDDRITNGDNGSYWNQEGGTVSGSVRVPRAVTLNLSLGSNLIPLNFVGISLDSNASVVDGKLVLNNSSGVTRYTGIVSSGKTYKIIITVDSVVSGAIKVWVGGNNTANITTAGTYEYLISKGTVNDWVGVNPTLFTGVVSYLSCQEVLSVDSIEPVNTDVLGQPLTYTKPAAINLEMVNSNCGTFDGDNDLVNIINGPISSVEFTWIFWMNLDLATKDETQWRNLFYSGNNNLYYFQSDGIFIRANDLSTSTNYIEGNFTTADFTGWKRVVITRTTSGLITTRVGDAVRTFQEDGSAGVAFTITSFSFNANTRNFAGSIYNLLAYTRVLSNDEIDNFNPYSPPTLNLELHWPFSEGEGSFLTDVSGNERHGTLINATLSEFWGTKQDLFHWNIKKGFVKGFSTSNNAYILLDSPFENPRGKVFKFGFVYAPNGTRQWLFNSNSQNFYAQLNNQNVQIEAQFPNNALYLNNTQFIANSYVEIEFLFPESGNLQDVTEVFINGISKSFSVATNIYGKGAGETIGMTSSFNLPNTTASVVFVKIGETLYSQLNNWRGSSVVNSASAVFSNLALELSEPVKFVAGKWHNGAETEFNAPSCPELVIANKQFDTGFWYTIPNKLIGSPTLSGGINVVGTTGTVDGVDDAIIITLNDVNNLHLAENGNVFENGKTYRVTFDYYIPSTNTQVNAILGPADANTIGNSYFSVLDAWTSVSVIITTKGDNNINGRKLRFYAAVGSSTSPILAENDWFALKNVTIYEEHNVNDIAYADIVDNYEDADTLFADVAEDNKRMKLLQYKNPLTE